MWFWDIDVPTPSQLILRRIANLNAGAILRNNGITTADTNKSMFSARLIRRHHLSRASRESSCFLFVPSVALGEEIDRRHRLRDPDFSCGDLDRLAFHSNASNRREGAYRLAYEHSKNRSLSHHTQKRNGHGVRKFHMGRIDIQG